MTEFTTEKLYLWLKIALVAVVLTITVKVGLHADGWLGSGDRIAASAEVTASNLQQTTKVIAQGAGPMMDSLKAGGVKLQMAMDSMQEAAEKVKDVLDNVRDAAAEVVNLTGSGTKLLDHVTAKVDAVHAEKIDAAIDAVHDLGVEGKGTVLAATAWMNAGTTTMTNASKLLADSDPLVINMGKISGDGYVYLHKVLNPDKHGHYTKMDYVKAIGYTGIRTAPGSAEFLYYLSNIKK